MLWSQVFKSLHFFVFLLDFVNQLILIHFPSLFVKVLAPSSFIHSSAFILAKLWFYLTW